ncbi:MAG: ABC transporter ATP-binding protein [Candidatus Electrothrix sp. AR3]|nr:ABC transporter ATP-binding protein [Candidatus Electrothrix sp. AR3]
MLELHKVSKKFGGVTAVDDCTFRIQKGKITAIIGPNGSGKTTLFNLISGIEQADSGSIVFNGSDITKLSVEAIAGKGISRSFQKTRLFANLTVRENLDLARDRDNTLFWKNFIFRRNHDGKAQNDLLKKLGIQHIADLRADSVSYGQRKLTEIARTIMMPHSLLLLDEPVAGVNRKIKDKLVRLFMELKEQKKTLLLIEHDMRFTLNVADIIIYMDKGSVVTQGSPAEIQKNLQVADAYLSQRDPGIPQETCS